MTFIATRRRFGAGLAAAGAVALTASIIKPAQAQSAKYRLRYGTAFPADHPGVMRIQEAGEAIEKETSGLVDLQVYPNSQLGSEAGHVLADALRRARLHVDVGREPDRRSDRRHQRGGLRLREL